MCRARMGEAGLRPEEIAVITPYNGQVDALRSLLKVTTRFASVLLEHRRTDALVVRRHRRAACSKRTGFDRSARNTRGGIVIWRGARGRPPPCSSGV